MVLRHLRITTFSSCFFDNTSFVNTHIFEPLSRQDQNEANCLSAKNASVNANIQQPKSIKQFSCKYPCGNCKNAVIWKTPGVCCDFCNKWFHKECLGMNTLVYQGLRNISWNCDNCGLPNLSSHIFDTSTITSVLRKPNSYFITYTKNQIQHLH